MGLLKEKELMMKNKLTTFFFVRHGETDWNKTGTTQGHTDTVLNTKGEEQAKNLAKQLKKINFDLAFSSDLLRAKRTTEIIALEHNLMVETTKLLREKNFGSLTGKPYELVMKHIKLLLALKKEERSQYKVAPDAESDEELATRVFTFLRETALAYPEKNILVGTHGGVLRVILIHLGIKTYEEYENMRMKNGGYLRLESDGVEFFVKETVGFEPRQISTSDL